MIKGVTEQELEIILTLLKPYKSQYSFYLYGSRVKGNFRPLSDLDILVESEDNDINLLVIDDIKQNFDNSKLPYVVNFSYNLDEKFYNLIKQDLVKI